MHEEIKSGTIVEIEDDVDDEQANGKVGIVYCQLSGIYETYLVLIGLEKFVIRWDEIKETHV